MDDRSDISASGDPFAPTPGDAKRRRTGHPVDPLRILGALRRAWYWVVVAAVVGAPLGYFLARTLTPPRYEATATLVYEGVPPVPGLPDTRHGELGTLVESVTIPPNLEETARRLDTTAPPDVLMRSLEVGSSYGSNVFTVTAKSRSAKGAADLANTVVEVFQEHRTEVEKTRLLEHRDSIDEDLAVAEKSAARARKRYDAFREEHGIANLTAEQEQAIQAAAELRAAADLARAEATAQDVRLKQLRGAAQRMRSTTVLSSTRTTPAGAELREAQSKLATARAQLSDDHPRVRALEAQVRALSERARTDDGTVSGTVVGANPAFSELQTSVTGTAADREAAHKREESLAALTKAARERVAQLSRVEGEASMLLAAVEVAETHVSDMQAKRARVDGAARSPVSGFRVVADARPPDSPVASTRPFVLMAGVPFFLAFLTMAALAFREIRGFRVATPAEVAYWGRGPVVGTTRWPVDPNALADLVSELDDHLPASSGRTLVVPALGTDRGIVAELACQLSEGWHPILDYQDERDDDEEEAIRDSVVVDAVTVVQRDSAVNDEGGDDEGEVAADGQVVVTQSTALVPREPDAIVELGSWDAATFEAKGWVGPDRGPRLRRASRLADRVLVVVSSRSISAFDLRKRVTQLGRQEGIGFVVVGADPDVADLPDRVGNVSSFWSPSRRP